MTTILGVQHKNGFTIASDSQVTQNERPHFHSDVKKITEVGQYVIAGAGVARYTDIIQYGWIPPVFTGEDHYGFMVSKFIPELRKAHEETGYTLKKNDDFSFLVGLDEKLFYITSEYAVLRSEYGLYPMGTGGELALGAHAAGATIKEAIKIAIKFDINSGGRIQIVKRGGDNA